MIYLSQIHEITQQPINRNPTLGVTAAAFISVFLSAFLTLLLVTGLASAVPDLLSMDVPARLRSDALKLRDIDVFEEAALALAGRSFLLLLL